MQTYAWQDSWEFATSPIMRAKERPKDCVFCQISQGVGDAKYVQYGVNTFGIEPLNPVVPGHAIFMPHLHVTNYCESPRISGYVMEAAARWAQRYESSNIISSNGTDATQSVFHLHIHVVPRTRDDGLHLPWTEN